MRNDEVEMTLAEIEAKLFPCVYTARNGQLIEITGFAFEGVLLNADSTKGERRYVWDKKMNFLQPSQLNARDLTAFDGMECVKSPTMDPNHKKNKALIAEVENPQKAS
jgi:hypothetical protein